MNSTIAGYGDIHIGDTMYREITNKLKLWKNNAKRKPLIIKGARQIGKTHSIRKFAKKEYTDVVEINFEHEKQYADFFTNAKDIHEIIQFLEIEYPRINFKSDSTLLFLDEIQACSRALSLLKFFSEDNSFDIICSGSLLGVAIAGSSSFPVGYVEMMQMYPMTFIEFLIALGIKQDTLDSLYTCINTEEPIPYAIHEKMNAFFDQYICCGGMPECVQTFIDTKSFLSVLKIQRQIISGYISDMAKYAPIKDKVKVHECFASIPLQLAKENKKFQYKLVQKGAGARHFESSLQWLIEAGTILKTNRLKSIQSPLAAYAELDIFKIYMADTGLLLCQLEDSTIKEILTSNLGVYKGALYENIVARTLAAYEKKAYYFEPTNHSEIDFIIHYGEHITPLKIKGGLHTKSKSLCNYVEKNNSPLAYRLSKKNIGKTDASIHYLPLYLLPFLLEKEPSLF